MSEHLSAMDEFLIVATNDIFVTQPYAYPLQYPAVGSFQFPPIEGISAMIPVDVNDIYRASLPPKKVFGRNGEYDSQTRFVADEQLWDGINYRYTVARTTHFLEDEVVKEGNMVKLEATHQKSGAYVYMRMQLREGQLWSVLCGFADPTHPLHMVSEIVYGNNRIRSVAVAPDVSIPTINTATNYDFENMLTQQGNRQFNFSPFLELPDDSLVLLTSHEGGSTLRLSVPFELSGGISEEILAFLYSPYPCQYDPKRFDPITRAGIEFNFGSIEEK